MRARGFRECEGERRGHQGVDLEDMYQGVAGLSRGV